MNNASIDEADFKKGDAMSPGLSPPQMPGHNGHPPRLSRSLPDRRGWLHATAIPISWNFLTPTMATVYGDWRESGQIRSMLAGEHDLT